MADRMRAPSDAPAAFAGKRVLITGAGRDFGRSLALLFAMEGAELVISGRDRAALDAVAAEIAQCGGKAQAHLCDLADPRSVAEFAAAVSDYAGGIDILVLNAARWLEEEPGQPVTDADIVETIASGLTGSILLTHHLLPALRAHGAADILAMISICGEPGYQRSTAHPAFYAAKHGLAGFCDILGARHAAEGLRVTGLFPPDFENVDPLSPAWQAARPGGAILGAPAVWNAVRFALTQPRDGGVRRIHFDGLTRLEASL